VPLRHPWTWAGSVIALIIAGLAFRAAVGGLVQFDD